MTKAQTKEIGAGNPQDESPPERSHSEGSLQHIDQEKYVSSLISSLFDAVSMPVLMCNPDLSITFANKAFLKMTNFKKLTLEKLFIQDIFDIPQKKVVSLKNASNYPKTPQRTSISSLNSNMILESGEKKEVILDILYHEMSSSFVIFLTDFSMVTLLKADIVSKKKLLTDLYNISNSIQVCDTVYEILDVSVSSLKLLGYDRIRIYLFDKDKGMLIGRRSSHLPDEVFAQVELEISKHNIKVYHCFTKKEPIIQNAPHYSKYASLLDKGDVAESASIPLLSKNRVIGMISIDNKFSRSPLMQEELYNLLPLANHIAFAIENLSLHEEDHRKLRKMSALYDTSTSLTRTFDMEKVLNIIVIKIVKLLKADICALSLIDASGEFLIPQSSYHIGREHHGKRAIPIDNSVSGITLKTSQPVYIEDVTKEERFSRQAFAKKEGIRTMLSIPLIAKDVPIGVINIYTKKPRKYLQEEIDLLMTLANQAALSIKNSELYSKMKKDSEVLSKLLDISQSLNSELNIENMFKLLLDKTIDFTCADSGFILLVKGDILELKMLRGYPKEKADRVMVKIGEGISGHVARTGKPLIIPNVREEPKYIEINKSTLSEAAIPLIKSGRVIGVFNLESSKFDNFSRFQKPLEILTNQVAIAIENSRLYHEISLFNETLKNEVFMATKELVEKNKQLERLSKLKSDFVSNVSHELRTPLTSIKGYTKLLMDGKLGVLPENQHQCLKIILEESDRLSRLINDVLDLAKLEKGKVKFKKEDMNILHVASEAIKTLNGLADDKGIKIRLETKNDIPEISASRDLIKQVFFNLIGNAIKFTPNEGNIFVIIETGHDFLKVTVKDTGIGVPKDELLYLFDKFYQVDSSMTRQHSGTGLGLSISKHIIDAHKGRIYAESELGKGSSFIFELPIKKEESNTLR